ncbi:uncharacterized protein LOC129690513 [Psammomys obesus]|uniref:uncharacterized protein LOC129690513 n=1 Tax=Psammomys obesus TaxID=48139 RepID=UPI002452960F|nr:uncharacterized protein LOC129690513 [Psammomys obesus]
MTPQAVLLGLRRPALPVRVPTPSLAAKRARSPRRQASPEPRIPGREDDKPGRGRHSPVAAQEKQFLHSLSAILGGRHRDAPPPSSCSAGASRPDVRAGADAGDRTSECRAGELALRLPGMPEPPQHTSALVHILRQPLTLPARSCQMLVRDPARVHGTSLREPRCALHAGSCSSFPLSISAPPVEMTALCTLALGRGGWEGYALVEANDCFLSCIPESSWDPQSSV